MLDDKKIKRLKLVKKAFLNLQAKFIKKALKNFERGKLFKVCKMYLYALIFDNVVGDTHLKNDLLEKLKMYEQMWLNSNDFINKKEKFLKRYEKFIALAEEEVEKGIDKDKIVEYYIKAELYARKHGLFSKALNIRYVLNDYIEEGYIFYFRDKKYEI